MRMPSKHLSIEQRVDSLIASTKGIGSRHPARRQFRDTACTVYFVLLGKVALPAALLALRAPVRANWVGIPSMR